MKQLWVLFLFPCLNLFAAPLGGWIGTYTGNSSRPTGSTGIYRFTLDDSSGALSAVAPIATTTNPSFLALHPSGQFLYAVNEDEDPSGIDRVSAFAMGTSPAQPLQLLGSVPSQGSAPCHLSVDATGRWLFAANYHSATIAVFPILADGRLGAAVQTIRQIGSGPIARRQEVAHAHQVVQSPDGRYLLAVDLGSDKVFVYRFDVATGKLLPNDPAAVSLPAGAGPRHMVFAKGGAFAYLVSELTPSVYTLRWDARHGTLAQLAGTSTLPADFSGNKSGAEIALHPSGRFLYASNRGDSNSIAIYRIGADGIPVAAGRVASGGVTPRSFAIDPSGHFLIVANQKTGNLAVFRIDERTGELGAMTGSAAVPAPVHVLFGSPP